MPLRFAVLYFLKNDIFISLSNLTVSRLANIEYVANYTFVILVFYVNANAGERKFSNEFLECMNKSRGTDVQSICINSEIIFQKNRLNDDYSKVVRKISPEDKKYLDKVQNDWIGWRDGNYNFLSEHIAGEFSTIKATSLSFLLNSACGRTDELEMILDELGNRSKIKVSQI